MHQSPGLADVSDTDPGPKAAVDRGHRNRRPTGHPTPPTFEPDRIFCGCGKSYETAPIFPFAHEWLHATRMFALKDNGGIRGHL
jgi:hypothetical protein